MRNILILIPITLLLAACNCDEDHPLVNTEELVVPDVFVVTDVRYTSVLLGDSPREGIQVLFNRNVNPEFVIDSVTFFLEGEDIFFSGSLDVDSNWIFVPCGYFYCLSAEDCKPVIRLASSPDASIRSTDDELLDGDRDGQPGGDFIQEVSVADCQFPYFGLSIFPGEDTLFISSSTSNTLSFEVDFTVEADPLTLQWNTGDDNIKIINLNNNEPVPFTLEWGGNNGIQSMDLIIYYPTEYCPSGQACNFRVIIEESFRSLLGIQLDGDGDGNPGGNFIKDYTIITDTGPLLQLKLPGNDTTYLSWPTDTNIVMLDFSFSLPVGPNNLIAGEDLRVYCQDNSLISSGLYDFFWVMNSDTDARLEMISEEPLNICGTIDDPNGLPVVVFKVVILDRVQSTNGIQLDGDYDGFPGGQAVKYFILSTN
ncbi:MAG: hypothetical protein H6573_24515 [Lewinellaceae bacterium]|nr:hypothetical protein [Phaeodactylibacter sp.]MCB0613085.1 hypothetical protein [Phaeodactylibacter sp.]MCB9350648.1 hypothetical protein [Lewinellaceae bacterium]